jgi:class 3 adenylate cyclase
MQAQMHRYAAIPTSAGIFNLSMKAGLASGMILCGCVGDDYRTEYIVAGKALDLCADAEHHATKDEVVVHNDLLSYLTNAYGEEEILGKVVVVEQRADYSCISQLLRAAPAKALPTLQSLKAATIQVLRPFLHPTLGQRLSEGQTDFINEHRKVTVLFVSFSGFDYDHDTQVGPKLQTYFSEVLTSIKRYDGYLNKIDMGDKGSKFIVLFGAPVAHENDEERALLCADELLAQANQHLASIKIGVNTGFVYSGLVGSNLRQEYTVMGDAVNLAARLMQAAKPGQALVSGFTQSYLVERCEWQSFEPIMVKGKSEPIPIFAVKQFRQTSTGYTGILSLQEPAYTLPMVGRTVELDSIKAKIALVQHKQGQIIGITAEAGMGKSRLASEALKLAKAAGLRGYGGECLSYATNSSYLVWHNIWRGLWEIDPTAPLDEQIRYLEANLASYDQESVTYAPLLASLLNLPIPDNTTTAALDPKTRKRHLETMLVRRLHQNCQAGPLLLVLEDCHWIDALSQELLDLMAHEIAELPVLLLLVYRPINTTDTSHLYLQQIDHFLNFTELRLQDFTPDEATALIRLKLGQLFGKDFDLMLEADDNDSRLPDLIK